MLRYRKPQIFRRLEALPSSAVIHRHPHASADIWRQKPEAKQIAPVWGKGRHALYPMRKNNVFPSAIS